MSDATDYFEDSNITRQPNRMSIPAFERLKQLYAFGHSITQMVEILSNEFGDIDYNPLTVDTLKIIINKNKEELERDRLTLTQDCRDHVRRQIARLFDIVQQSECRMVEVYVRQFDKLINQLADLDMDARDPSTGAYLHTSRCFVLLELIDKIQGKISKVVGTDAMREIEIYKQKMAAKIEAEGLDPSAGALPPIREANGSIKKTKWI